MRPLRYSINVTLDGCVDHMAVSPSEDIHLYAMGKIAEADALLFGRTTYEMMEQAWRPPASDAFPAWTQPFARTINAAKKYVVSRTLAHVDWNAELVRGELGDFVRALKAMPGNGIYTGGVMLPKALAEMGLIDEYEFVIHPRIVGRGPALFAGLVEAVDLRLVGREELGESGAIVLRYVAR
jgi:dihydrofolate reductase